VKKYFTWMSFGSLAMIRLALCSKGRRMLIPIARSWPAPTWAASMIPSPPPVMTIHPFPAISLPNATAWR